MVAKLTRTERQTRQKIRDW